MVGLFQVCACFALSSGADAEFAVLDPEGQPLFSYGESRALLVGVSNYDEWRGLPSIPGELAALEEVLVEHGFSVQTFLDLGEDDLRRTFENFIDRFGFDPDNRLLLYFAGHGYTRRVHGMKRGYLVPADAPEPDRVDPSAFLEKSISMDVVRSWARTIEARHALFLLDSCFSGLLFETRSSWVAEPLHITQYIAHPVRQFLTAGGEGEVPSKSLFAPAVVRGLRGAADLSRDGYITGRELGLYLQENAAAEGLMPRDGRLPNYRQGEFVFSLPLGMRPPKAKFEIGDLVRAAEREGPWRAFQADMNEAFDQARALDRDGVSVTIKSQAWKRFLSAFDSDNPQSERDEELRRVAQTRLDLLGLDIVQPLPREPTEAKENALEPGDLWIDPAIGMRFRYVPPGTFMMGSPPDVNGG
ncbi:MAG: caspase family protein [Acidobacteriota bacterium]